VVGRILAARYSPAPTRRAIRLTVLDHAKASLRILDVEEIKTVPYVPLSHPFVERPAGGARGNIT
jgi:hypothetical protein